MSRSTAGIITRRVIYAECKTLEDVIKASCHSKITKRNICMHDRGRHLSTTVERVREIFESGTGFNWANGEGVNDERTKRAYR